MIRVVASDAIPEDRAWLCGRPVKISNIKVGPSTVEQVDGSDVVSIPVTYDVEFEPIYQAVIRLEK